jgi:flagellum-specific ATP synthase
MSDLSNAVRAVASVQPLEVTGRVVGLRGLTVMVRDLPLGVGSLVELPRSEASVEVGLDGRVVSSESVRVMLGEVVGFSGDQTIVMTLGQTSGVRVGDPVVGVQQSKTVMVGNGMLGRVVDGLGRAIDGLGAMHDLTPREVDPEPVPALGRERVKRAMATGVRAIDLMCTMGCGQRLGVFAGPGVGKSTLLGTIARNCAAQVNVLALIGERGREVKDFIEGVLGAEGLARSVVVCSTSDESPLMRIRAAMVACSVAEHFRDSGQDVLLMVDSVTRFAHAHRQVGLSVGEPPASKGYTPGVFAALPRLLERAGPVVGRDGGRGGSITGVYTVLVEGDDMTEPIADAARGILDGHLILSRSLAQRAHYPAIDVLDSVSRVGDDVCDEAHRAARRQLRRLMAAYREVEDLIQIGAYARGANHEVDVAVEYWPRINELLRQASGESDPLERTRERAIKLAMDASAALARPARRAS